MNLKRAFSITLVASIAILAAMAEGQTRRKEIEAAGAGSRVIVGMLRSFEVKGYVFGADGCTERNITVYRVEAPVAGTKTNSFFVTLLTEKSEVEKECRRLTGKKVRVDGVFSSNLPGCLNVRSITEQK